MTLYETAQQLIPTNTHTNSALICSSSNPQSIQALEEPLLLIKKEDEPIVLSDLQKYFLAQVEKIKSKADDLENKENAQTAHQLHVLYDVVKENYEKLLAKEIDKERFNENCSQVISEAIPVIEKHRSYMEVFGHLALAGFVSYFVSQQQSPLGF